MGKCDRMKVHFNGHLVSRFPAQLAQQTSIYGAGLTHFLALSALGEGHLTVRYEESIEEAYERTLPKYQELVTGRLPETGLVSTLPPSGCTVG